MADQAVREVERFLYREARLLDERRFAEWLDLLAEDLHYSMVLRADRYPPESKAVAMRDPARYAGRNSEEDDGLAILDETKESLRSRVARLGSGMAWAEDPPSRTRHFLANVEVEPSEKEAELAVRANFVVYRSRGESEQDLYVGARRDLLRRTSAGLVVARRRLILDQNILQAKNVSIFF